MNSEEMRELFLNLSSRLRALEHPCEQQTSTADFVIILILCTALAVVGEACCGKERY
jgi:hypothetical protein